MSERLMQVGDSYEVDVPMRWADADMMQHLNNVMYFRYMEQARVELVDICGIRETPQYGFVVAHCSCDFLKPVLYPATIRVRMVIERVGRSSFDHQVEMRLADDPENTLYATGRVVMVMVEKESGRSVALPESLLTRLGRLMQPAA